MKMVLKKFQVTNFKSVEDSGWIEVDDVTALIGTNEAGKTNILLPLWKFNPAKEGDIVPSSDYPRKYYSTFRHEKPKPVFIRTVFEIISNKLAQKLADKTGLPIDDLRTVEVSRRLDGDYEVDFPKATPPRSVPKSQVSGILEAAENDINAMTALKSEEDLARILVASLKTGRGSLPDNDVDVGALDTVLSTLEGVKTEGAPKTSTIVPRHKRASDDLQALKTLITRTHPKDVEAAVDLVLQSLPTFVFYSTYGNLDSEIYLPHVIANLARKDLGAKELAKARTLKVLFEFVRLKPEEILELGRDFKDPSRPPTPDEIAAIAEKKKQRSILLQSASTLLTTQFKERDRSATRCNRRCSSFMAAEGRGF